jgi:hypothetical protein
MVTFRKLSLHNQYFGKKFRKITWVEIKPKFSRNLAQLNFSRNLFRNLAEWHMSEISYFD